MSAVPALKRLPIILITAAVLWALPAGGASRSQNGGSSLRPPGGGAVAAKKGPRFVEGDILVKFKPLAARSERGRVRGDLGARRLHEFKNHVEHWRLDPGRSMEQALDSLRRNPQVEYAEPDYIVGIALVPNDPGYASQWGLENEGQTGGTSGADISAEDAWNISVGDRAVLVGVLDTGIDYTHPDLAANIWTNPGEIPGNGIDDDGNGFIDDVHGWDFRNDDNEPLDDHGHGSHVAGIIGALGNNNLGVTGVAWNVSLVPLKFLGADGNGSTSAAVRAIDYATDLGVRIINNSWGGYDFSRTLADTMGQANEANVVIVAAAGNDSNNTDTLPFYPAGYVFPNIIAVGATDAFDQKAAFSNYGPHSVHIAAPGKDILSTIPGGEYGLLSGTSMAAPHVTGAAVLVRSLAPEMLAAQVRQRLLDSATSLGSLNGMVEGGRRLNAYTPILTQDDAPPGSIQDLTVESANSNSLVARWTATGDDGDTGRAVSYDLRFTTDPPATSDVAEWSLALHPPQAQPAGSVETMEVTGLAAGTDYVLTVRARDEWGNPGPYGNLATGRTLPAPTLASSPSSFSVALRTGESTTRTLTIRNAGVGTLDWTIPQPAISGPGGGLAGVSTPAVPGPGAPGASPQAGGTGGPDPFGYRYIDSDQPGGPVFDWLDLTTSGTGLPIETLIGDDQISDMLPIGFSFPFYGQTFDGVRVSTNGFLTFTGNNAPYLNKILPDLAAPPNLIAPFWDDLQFQGLNRAYYTKDADSFTVQYTQTPPYVGLGHFTFQVTLYRSGEILFRYFSMTGETGSATIGIQDGTQRRALQIRYNSIYLHDRMAIRIFNVPQWLLASPSSGRLAAGEPQDVTVGIDASSLEGGTYTGTVVVASNDPDRPFVDHVVTLEITPIPMIVVDGGLLDFGNVFVGSRRVLPMQVRNTGTDVLHVGSISSGDPAVTADPTLFDVPKGESRTVMVTYAPQAPATLDSTLVIGSDAGNAPAFSVQIRGSATPPPQVVITPPSFSETLLTGWSVTRPLRIANTGGSDLVLGLQAEITTGPAQWLRVAPPQDTIRPGEAHDFTVTLDAGDFGTTVLAGAIVVQSNAPGSPAARVPVTLSVTGAPNIAISDEPFTVESQKYYIGYGARTDHRLPIAFAPGSSAALEVTVDGNYGGALETAQVSTEGITLGTLGSGGGGCVRLTRTFQLDPTQLAALTADDAVEVKIQNSDFVDYFCATNRHTVRLSYVGARDLLDFGPIYDGLRKTMTVAVHNRGSEALKVQSIAADGAEFIPGVTSLDVPARSTAGLSLTFAPTAARPYDATLTIVSNDPDTPVLTLALRGIGLLAPLIGVQPPQLATTLLKKSRQLHSLSVSNAGGSALDFSVKLRVRTTAPDPSLCTPRAYVSEWSAGRASMVNLATGLTTHIAFGLRTPQENMVIDPSATTAFVAESDPGNLAAIDLATGRVTRVVSGLDFPVGVALTPSGGTAYVTEAHKGTITAVDLSTGALTPVASGLGGPSGLALNRTLTTAYVNEREAGRFSSVDLQTGTVTPILTGLVGPNSVVLNRDETVAYVTESTPERGRFLSVDLATRVATVLDSTLLDPLGIALSADGTVAYIAELRRVNLRTINLVTLAKSQVGFNLSGPAGIAVLTPSGCRSDFLTVDPMSGRVLPGESQDLGVLFDSGELFGGSYQTDIEITSNDPTTAILNIPAILTVNPICADLDKDGYAVCSDACALAGINRCGDCDDFDPEIHPFLAETCNNRDDNCNGLIDESVAGIDSDGDLVGDACDNCLLVWNPVQEDSDADGLGDVCEEAAICSRANLDTAEFSKARVDGRDLATFARAFGTCPADSSSGSAANLDLALEGPEACVDMADFHLFMSVFALTCEGG